jgi:hypothetical protein
MVAYTCNPALERLWQTLSQKSKSKKQKNPTWTLPLPFPLHMGVVCAPLSSGVCSNVTNSEIFPGHLIYTIASNSH